MHITFEQWETMVVCDGKRAYQSFSLNILFFRREDYGVAKLSELYKFIPALILKLNIY